MKKFLLLLPLLLQAGNFPSSGVFGEIGDDFELTNSLLDNLSLQASVTCAFPCESTPIDQAGIINASGAYCVAAPIDGTITIDADNVVLDLNGYTVKNGGIAIESNHRCVVIRNGFVRNSGIFADSCSEIVLKKLTIDNVPNAISFQNCSNCLIAASMIHDVANGIRLTSCTNSLINDCLISTVTQGNDVTGILASGSAISCTNCHVMNLSGLNDALGFRMQVDDAALICCSVQGVAGGVTASGFIHRSGEDNAYIDCHVGDISADTMTGFESVEQVAVYDRCTVIGLLNNGSTTIADGFAGQINSVFKSCKGVNLTTVGVTSNVFSPVSGNLFENCIAFMGDNHGFNVSASNRFINCIADRNATNGFNLSGGNSVLKDCIAFSNAGTGFDDPGSNDFLYDNIARANGLNYNGVANVSLQGAATFAAGDNIDA